MKASIYLIFLLICMNNLVVAQKNVLKGSVFFENDSAARNIEIRIYDEDDKPLSILYTDKQGYFQFSSNTKILTLDIRSNDLNFKSSVDEYVFNPKDTANKLYVLARRDPEEVELIQQGIQKIPTTETPKLADQFCPDFISGVQDTATFKEVYACLVSNIKYPVEAEEAGAQGKVKIKFIVDENGKICNVEIMQGSYAILEEESLRAASCLSGMSPASCGGKKVSTYYSLPLTFRLN